MARAAPPVFLARAHYRRRRLLDALWLVPVLGAVLFAVPLLWPVDERVGVAPVSNGTALVYLFGVWAVLIVLGAALSAAARRGSEREGGDTPDADAADAQGGSRPPTDPADTDPAVTALVDADLADTATRSGPDRTYPADRASPDNPAGPAP